jgi:hypothetical protein
MLAPRARSSILAMKIALFYRPSGAAVLDAAINGCYL